MALSANIHLFIGADDYETDTCARKVFAACMPDTATRESALEIIDASSATNAETQLASIRAVSDSAFTPPFLDPAKGTWWRNVSFLPAAGKASASEDVKVALERLAGLLVKNPRTENHPVVITAPHLLKTSIFAKTLAKVAELTIFATATKPRDRLNAALARLPELAAEVGLTFAPGADRVFVTQAGTDTRTLLSELTKMATWMGTEKHPVTAKDIELITSPAIDEEIEIWAVQDALANRDTASMLHAVRGLQGDKGWAIKVLQVLINFTRDMVVARDQVDRGLPVPGNGWIAQKNAQRCMTFRLAEWRRIRFRLLSLRERLVSTVVDDAYVELELLRITKK